MVAVAANGGTRHASPAQLRPHSPSLTAGHREVALAALPDCEITQIAAGRDAAFALASNGEVWSWGFNNWQLLGQADTGLAWTAPAAHSSLTAVSMIATHAQSTFAVAVHLDGSVSAWGQNGCGLGDGVSTDSALPVPVSGLTGIISAAVGGLHALALRGDGQVFAWGCNGDGQLGNGVPGDAPTPVAVVGLSAVEAVSAGEFHSLALRGDQTVWAWGLNDFGQLGDNSQTDRPTPVQVSGIVDAVAIAGGAKFSLALRNTGTVLAWGENTDGQIGDGSYTDRDVPVTVNGLANIVSIAGGMDTALAIRGDGSAVAWGEDYELLLGIIQQQNSNIALTVAGVAGAVRGSIGESVALALRGDGTVAAWGVGAELGNRHLIERKTPVRSLTGGFAKVDAGDYHSLGINTSGEVMAWGWSWAGMSVGDAYHSGVGIPSRVNGISGAIDVAAGFEHSLAVDGSGQVWAWGSNWGGFLGDNSFNDSLVPVQTFNLNNAVDVAACWESSYAVLSDGTVRSWGQNWAGMLGDGTNTDSDRPVTVSGLDQVTAIDCYEYSVVALRADGTVWAWGAGYDGQLGQGDYNDSNVPVQVPGLVNAISVASAGHYTLAVTSDGNVWAWGNNGDGGLGQDPAVLTDSTSPIQVAGIGNAAKVTAGHGTSHALLNDGTMMSWGGNYWGQLGTDSALTLDPVPAPVPGLVNVISITAGEELFFALGADGFVSGAGYNFDGSLADGAVSATHRPVEVDFDTPPGNQGNTLYAVRSASDVVLSFPAAPAAAWKIFRDDSPAAVGTTPLSPNLTSPTYSDLGDVPAANRYYAVRGLSPCTFQPGP